MSKLVFLMLTLVLLVAITGCAKNVNIDPPPEDTTPPQEAPVNTTPIQEEANQLIDENEDVDIGDVI